MVVSQSLLQDAHVRRQVRDKHVSRRVRNGERHLAFHQCRLRCHPARVKDGHFVVPHRNGFAPIRLVNIVNANGSGTTHADGCSVRVRVLACDFHLLGDFQTWNGFHAHHHVSAQTARGFAGDIGFEHGHVLAGFGRAQWNSSVEQGFIVGKAASNEKRNSVFRPVIGAVGDFLFEFSVAVNGVPEKGMESKRFRF